MRLMLAKNRFGRMVLHVSCLVHDRKWRWHWAGIWRELHPLAHDVHRIEGAAEFAALDTAR